MKQASNALYKSLRLLVLASACLTATAHADDYTEVTQLLRANKLSEAMTRVSSVLAAKPGDPQMRFFKGVIQSSQGKPLDAIDTFTLLTQDYPELPEPYNNLAVLYAAQGSYDKARLTLEMAIHSNPNYATAQENLGDVYAKLASQAYSKALQLDTGNTTVPHKLALIGEVFTPRLGQPGTSASPPVAIAAPMATAATPAASSKAVEVAVLAWAQAWSANNIDAYLKAYSPDFTPPDKQSPSAWEKERRASITGKKSISVTLTKLDIRVQGDQAVASFRQAYQADSLPMSSQKTLNLRKSGQTWLITQESTER